jgi:hypothetical protein
MRRPATQPELLMVRVVWQEYKRKERSLVPQTNDLFGTGSLRLEKEHRATPKTAHIVSWNRNRFYLVGSGELVLRKCGNRFYHLPLTALCLYFPEPVVMHSLHRVDAAPVECPVIEGNKPFGLPTAPPYLASKSCDQSLDAGRHRGRQLPASARRS